MCSPDHSPVAGLCLAHHHRAWVGAVTLRDSRKCPGTSLSSGASEALRLHPGNPALLPQAAVEKHWPTEKPLPVSRGPRRGSGTVYASAVLRPDTSQRRGTLPLQWVGTGNSRDQIKRVER